MLAALLLLASGVIAALLMSDGDSERIAARDDDARVDDTQTDDAATGESEGGTDDDCGLSEFDGSESQTVVGCGEEVRLSGADLAGIGEFGEDSGDVNDPPLTVGVHRTDGCSAEEVERLDVQGAQVVELDEYDPDSDLEVGVWQDVLVLADRNAAEELWQSRVALGRTLLECGNDADVRDAVEFLSPDGNYSRSLNDGVEAEVDAKPEFVLFQTEERPLAILWSGRYYSELWLSGTSADSDILEVALDKMREAAGG